MIKNYLLIALRNFWRNKVSSLINIAGLAIGISASLVIYLIVHHEFSYEKVRRNGNRIAAKEHYIFHIALPTQGENTDSWKKTIAGIGSAWNEIYPQEEFKYEFLDESIAKFYKKEQDTANFLNWSTGLAIFISCLGLFGLVIYTTTQRTKEIGVRKVLGASVSQIVSLLSRDFVSLVLLAFVIAALLAWVGNE